MRWILENPALAAALGAMAGQAFSSLWRGMINLARKKAQATSSTWDDELVEAVDSLDDEAKNVLFALVAAMVKRK